MPKLLSNSAANDFVAMRSKVFGERRTRLRAHRGAGDHYFFAKIDSFLGDEFPYGELHTGVSPDSPGDALANGDDVYPQFEGTEVYPKWDGANFWSWAEAPGALTFGFDSDDAGVLVPGDLSVDYEVGDIVVVVPTGSDGGYAEFVFFPFERNQRRAGEVWTTSESAALKAYANDTYVISEAGVEDVDGIDQTITWRNDSNLHWFYVEYTVDKFGDVSATATVQHVAAADAPTYREETGDGEITYKVVLASIEPDIGTGLCTVTHYHVGPVLVEQDLQSHLCAFGYYYDGEGDSTSTVTIRAGEVRDLRNGSATVAESSVSLASATDVWVEVTINDDGIVVVTGAMQTGAYPGYITDDGGAGTSFTLCIKLGSVTLGNRYMPSHMGDIHLPYMFTPSFHTDIRGGDAREAQMLGMKAATSVGATEDLFLDLRQLDLEFKLGALSDATDGGALQFGGVTATVMPTLVSGAALQGDNVTLRLSTTDVTAESERGLTQQLATGAGANIDVDLSGLVTTEGYKVKADAGDAAPGYLSAKVDNSTIEVTGGDVLAVKDDGITGAKLAAAIAGDGLAQTVAGNLEVSAKRSITIDADELQLVNDETTPGALDIYAYQSGSKGWKALTALLAGLTGYDGSGEQVLVNDTGTIRWVDLGTFSCTE